MLISFVFPPPPKTQMPDYLPVLFSKQAEY